MGQGFAYQIRRVMEEERRLESRRLVIRSHSTILPYPFSFQILNINHFATESGKLHWTMGKYYHL